MKLNTRKGITTRMSELYDKVISIMKDNNYDWYKFSRFINECLISFDIPSSIYQEFRELQHAECEILVKSTLKGIFKCIETQPNFNLIMTGIIYVAH